jgi:hypothetical protein
MAKGDFGNKRNTAGFDKNSANINRKGQPRKTINSVNIELESIGYTEATINDIKSCYLRLLNVDLTELTRMVSDIEQPAMIRIVGKSILSGKGFDVIEKMLDRSIGTAKQTIEQKNTFEDGQGLPISVNFTKSTSQQ